jgi:integrase
MSKRRGNGEGSIYQTSDGRWRGAITLGYRTNENGGVTQTRKILSAPTRAEIADKMKKALRDQQEGDNIAPEKMTVAGLIHRWLDDIIKPSRSQKTFYGYRDFAKKHIIPALGKTPLSKLATPQIQRFLNEKYAAGLSPKTVKHLRDCLRAALNVAVDDWNLLSKNPARKARPPEQVDRPMQVFELDEARAFLGLIGSHRLEALFSLAICLGPRQGEILGLKWPNVKLDEGTLTIDGALKSIDGKLVKGKTKRKSSMRTIPLPAVTVAALRRHLAQQERERLFAGERWKSTGYVFTTRVGTPIGRRNLLRDWYRFMAASGLPQIRFHDLRHSCATLLMLQGVHPRTVMEILGHKDLNTTMRIYGHCVDAMKRDAAARVDQLFAPVATNLATTEQPTSQIN